MGFTLATTHKLDHVALCGTGAGETSFGAAQEVRGDDSRSARGRVAEFALEAA